MAIRQTRHVLKNSDIVNRPLPTTILKGEPIVNIADGIMLLSGSTQSTSGWTKSGPSAIEQTFFEVGSNLYDLNIRNKITKYSGLTDLTGKFLSGTTNGFVLGDISELIPESDVFVSGGTYNAGTATFTNTSGGTFNVTGFTTTDTYTTGFTYNPLENKLSILRNQGLPNLDISILSVSGLTVNDLSQDRLVFTTTNGKLITGTATFDGTNMVLPSNGSLSVGTGGLVIGTGGSPNTPGIGDLTVNGNLTVFGTSISAFTSQLYVEDSNVTFNYNPTGNTTSTSVGSGLSIQDGNGINGGNVNLDIRNLNGFTGLTSTQIPSIDEYSGSTGYQNRGWVTQLNDIIIRSTNINTPNGVRLLAEWDVLDGGSF